MPANPVSKNINIFFVRDSHISQKNLRAYYCFRNNWFSTLALQAKKCKIVCQRYDTYNPKKPA